MGNFTFNIVEEKTSFDGLEMLFKEVDKITATASRWSPALLPDEIFFVFFVFFVLFFFKKKEEIKSKKSERKKLFVLNLIKVKRKENHCI